MKNVFLLSRCSSSCVVYSLRRKQDFIEKFEALFEYGDCSKVFHGGRGGVATASVVCVFTPAGVMVAWKVLPTPESVYDVVDFVRWLKVGEALPAAVWSVLEYAV